MSNKAKRIIVPEFKYNPKDPRSTFLSLVTKTYPHGHEEEVLKFLPSLDKDGYGNYYKIIGENKKPSVMFTSHLDTADSIQSDIKLFSSKKDGSEFISTDGMSILGADDKAGVTVMLYMMAHNVPGIYYFFIGEEVGAIGSSLVYDFFKDIDFLSNVTKCISFDRRDTQSVITKQLGDFCCSDVFAQKICDEYNKQGFSFKLDPTGIFTDSAILMNKIPECTNISVGYNNEHTESEYQDMTYLIKLCEYSVNVDWDGLPVHREVYSGDYLMKKYEYIIQFIESKSSKLNIDFLLDDTFYIIINFNNEDIDFLIKTISELKKILERNNIQNTVNLKHGFVKIKLY